MENEKKEQAWNNFQLKLDTKETKRRNQFEVEEFVSLFSFI